MLDEVDPLNFTVAQLRLLFDELEVGVATGFFYAGFIDKTPVHWLITNWHVLTGRNANNPLQALHAKGAIPNRLRLSLILNEVQPEYEGRRNEILIQDQAMDLYNSGGQAVWFQHPRKNEIDVAVIGVGPLLSGDRFRAIGINEVARQNDMAIEIGNEVLILGYPLGYAHFLRTPIWKRGSIASEPHREAAGAQSRVVIDATTRQGMSGGPVIMRAKTHYLNEAGEITAHANATRWIGVYASRPDLPAIADAIEDDRRAEIGFFYKSGDAAHVITDGLRGPDFGGLP